MPEEGYRPETYFFVNATLRQALINRMQESRELALAERGGACWLALQSLRCANYGVNHRKRGVGVMIGGCGSGFVNS